MKGGERRREGVKDVKDLIIQTGMCIDNLTCYSRKYTSVINNIMYLLYVYVYVCIFMRVCRFMCIYTL